MRSDYVVSPFGWKWLEPLLSRSLLIWRDELFNP